MDKIAKEKRIVEKMINIYCRHKHKHHDGLCPDCAALVEYAHARLDRCPFGERKKSCRRCTIHCYRPQMKTQIRSVMRYSGPRMIIYAPITTLKHLLPGF